MTDVFLTVLWAALALWGIVVLSYIAHVISEMRYAMQALNRNMCRTRDGVAQLG